MIRNNPPYPKDYVEDVSGNVPMSEVELSFPKPIKKDKKTKQLEAFLRSREKKLEKAKKVYKKGPQFKSLSEAQRKKKRAEYFERKKQKVEARKERKKLFKDTHVPLWEKKAVKAFQLYVRLRDSVKTTGTIDYCICISCGKNTPFKSTHPGHFISGRNNKVLFDEKCCHGQCNQCNIFLRGNWAPYYISMVKMYGEDFVKKMINESREVKLYTLSDYKEMIEKYTQEIKNIRNKYGKHI